MIPSPTRRRVIKGADALRNATIRDFSGGWNVIDNDLNLHTKYSKRMKNVIRGADGSVNVRAGTRLFATLPTIDRVVNMEYFANALIVVGANGHLVAVGGDGSVLELFNDEIASSLPGAPSGWGTTEFVSFAQFRGSLIVCNGLDKPLIVNGLLQCEYLHDLATGTNIHTPVCRYTIGCDRYLVMAGDPLDPSLVHVSNIDSSGTWFGDTAPNDGIQFDAGPFVAIGSPVIKGLGVFSDRLIIMFEEVTVVFRLGEYVSSAHTPIHEDTVYQHGTISHRAIQSLGNDILFCDIVGVPSFRRALFTDEIRPDRVSELIDPAIQARLDKLSTASLEDRVFSVYNRRDGQYMLFIPNDNVRENTTETVCFVFLTIEALKIASWHEFRGWNWSAACRSAQGRVFFAKDACIHVLGTDQDVIAADYVGQQEPFEDGTVFTDGYGFAAEGGIGVPIAFEWELPWFDLDHRDLVKSTRYLQIDSRGTARFAVHLFVDNLVHSMVDLGEAFSDGTRFTDGYGFTTEDVPKAPALTLEMVGGDAPGYGLQPYGNSLYGGGRRASDERLYAFTAHGKLFKLAFDGAVMAPLKLVTLSLNYLLGSIRR